MRNMISIEFIRSPQDIRTSIEESGVSIAEWSRANGFSCGLVYQVLEGRRKCLRGQSYRIAVALGLKQGKPLDVAALSALLAVNAMEQKSENKEIGM